MSIDQHRRARLAAIVTTLAPEQVQRLKTAVEDACGHPYSDVQTHAWAMCKCGRAPCPQWVEQGFAAGEVFVQDPSTQTVAAPENSSNLDAVLDETALEMTGLLRDVVLDENEISSSKEAEQGDVFASSDSSSDSTEK